MCFPEKSTTSHSWMKMRCCMWKVGCCQHLRNPCCFCHGKITFLLTSCLFSSMVLDLDLCSSSRKKHFRLVAMVGWGDAGDSGHLWYSLAGVHLAVDCWLDGPPLLEEREGPRQFLHPLPDGAGWLAWDSSPGLKFPFPLAYWRPWWRCWGLMDPRSCCGVTQEENTRQPLLPFPKALYLACGLCQGSLRFTLTP